MEDKKKVTKYTALYMSLGMCFGMSMGLCVGMSFFDNMAMGLSWECCSESLSVLQ